MTDDTSAVVLRDVGPMIVATVGIAGCDPGRALDAFTDPAVLARWWRGELTAELVPGGRYNVNFPAIPARLTGRVAAYIPARSLEFSWAWEDDDGPASTVHVRVDPGDSEGSALLTIEHGPHRDDEEGRAAHSEHWAGWEFFLPGLPAALGPAGLTRAG